MALAVHDERLTRRVGFAVLLAAALTVVFVVMIWPRLGQAGLTVRVRFGVVVGLPAGAPVRVAGKDVGHVRSIGISRDPRDPRGQAGVVAVLSIDPEWAGRIPRNADFFVDARSLLAPRYIAIGPPPGHAAPERALRDGDEIDGIDPPSLDNVLQRTWDTLEEVSRFMDAIQPAAAKIDASAGRLAATIASLDPRPGASEELRRSVAEAAGAAEQLVEAFAAGRVDPAADLQVAGRFERREHLEEVGGDGDLADRSTDLAVHDQEAGRAPAVVAGNTVHALADQLGYEDGARKRAEQLVTAAPAREEGEVAGTCARSAADAARGVAGRRDAQLPRGSAVGEPGRQHPVLDQVHRP